VSPSATRADGAIRAGVSIDGLGHSIGSVKKGAPIYTGAAEVKGGSIASLNGPSARKGATVGRSYTVRFFTRDGQRVTKKMVLRAERKATSAASRWLRSGLRQRFGRVAGRALRA
jgi:hypothetical protein